MDQEDFELLWEARERESRLPDDQILICECQCVSFGDVRRFLQEKDFNLEELKEHFGLGAGCSSCLKSMASWKDNIN